MGTAAASVPPCLPWTLVQTESPSDTKGDGSDDRWGASYGLQLRILFTRMLKTRRFEALGTQDVTQFVVRALHPACVHCCLWVACAAAWHGV